MRTDAGDGSAVVRQPLGARPGAGGAQPGRRRLRARDERGLGGAGRHCQPSPTARRGWRTCGHRIAAVFVDATAAWCITCLVNEKVALSGARVRAAFRSRNIAFLVADWTNRNPEITALLQAHGRSGVPLYLYYAPGAAQAKVLPQILTEDDVLSALGAR